MHSSGSGVARSGSTSSSSSGHLAVTAALGSRLPAGGPACARLPPLSDAARATDARPRLSGMLGHLATADTPCVQPMRRSATVLAGDISQQYARCPRCRGSPSALERGRAVGPYESTLRRIVHLFKYDRRHTLAAPLGALMRQHGADLLVDADCVVPVPLHPRRRRARGFNQAAELAAHLGPPVVHALRRTVATPPQTGLPAAQRHGNVRRVFAPARARRGWGAKGHAMQGACVVLVDDVSTTGATLEACARVLRRCGVGEVRALTLARVVRRDLSQRRSRHA